MSPASMFNDYFEAPIRGNSELSEEENATLRLKKAQRAIEPIDGHYRRRLAFNIARLSIVEQSVTLLDGPALSLASEPTSDSSENPGLPPPATMSLPAEDRPRFQPGLAFTVGLIPIVGPCISLWLSHKMVCSKLSGLKLSHERQIELQQKMVATMSQDFLLRLCVPLVGPVISHYAQPHHAILKHADELVSAQTQQIQQRFDELVHETLAENELSLEQWESYNADRVHAAAAAPPSLAPPAVGCVFFDREEAMALEFIEPTVPEASPELADSAAEPYIVRFQSSGVHVANVPALSAQVGASSTPGVRVDVGHMISDGVASWCSSEYSFSVHRESSILDETTSVAGEVAETQSSSSALVVSAEQTPHPRIMPVDPITDAAAVDVSSPMSRQIPLISEHVPGITQGALSLTRAVELHDSSPTVAMPPYLEALLVYWPLIQHSVPQQNDDEEETMPTTVLHVHRVIIDIPEMSTIAVASTSSLAVPATASSAVPAPMSSATSGPGLISANANASEVSDTPKPQASEDQALAESDLACTSQYNTPTPTSDSPILQTSQPDVETVEVAFSSSSPTLSFSTTSSPSLSAQERIYVAPPPMTTTIDRPEDLPTRFRDLSIHMLEAGPTRINSPSASEDDSPAATTAALPTESRTASTSSKSSSTLSATSAPAPRSRLPHLQAPPTFATAGRFQFSSSNEVSSEEEDYGNDFGRDEADDDDLNQEEYSSGERNQVDATLVDSNHSHQQGAQPQASAVSPEDEDMDARDERGFKIVRPLVRLRPGYRLQNLNHDDLFVDFDSVGSRLSDHDRNYRRRRVAGMSEPGERGETQLDSLALRVSSLTTRGSLRARNPDPRSDLESSRHRPQDADAATLDAAFVDLELSRGPVTTQAGGLARGGSHDQQNVSQPSRTAEKQGFLGVAGDKAEIEEEDEQDNGRDVKTQALAIGGQWQSKRRRTQHPITIMASQDRRESVLSFPLPLHPPPIPPRPPHRPLPFVRIMSPGRDSMASISSSAPPPPPQQQQPSTQPQQQVRPVTDQPLNKQQPLPQQHIQPSFQQQSLHVGEAPTYYQYPTATSTGIHSSEISVPLGSMDTYVANSEPPTSTTTASTAAGTGAGAGEDWSSNPTPPTEQAASLLLCTPFVPKFDDSDDEISPVVAVRVPNSRSGLRLPFQNQASHHTISEGQQQIPTHTVPLMSRSLYHDATVPQQMAAAGAAGATGATFGLGGGRMTEEAIENEVPQISEPTHIFGQRLIARDIAAARSWHARHEQDQMFTSRNNVNSYASQSSSSSAQQPFHQQQQQQQPLQYQPQQQVLNQQQHQLHHHHQLQQPLQSQHQPKYQEQPQRQESIHLPGGGQQRTWSQTTYDPTEDLNGDNDTDADAAFLSARLFQDPLLLQQQHHLHQPQSATNINDSNHFIGGLLTPPLQPWLTGPTSSSQYPSSRTIHPRLLFQQQQQTHHHQQQILSLQQQQLQWQQLQPQYLLPNQSGFNSGPHRQHHQHQHTNINPSQTPNGHFGFPPQQHHHQQQQVVQPSPQFALPSQDRELQLNREYQHILQQQNSQQQQQQQQLEQQAHRKEKKRRQLRLQFRIREMQQGQDRLSRALLQSQSQEQARLGMTLAQQVQVRQVQVPQPQGLRGVQGQWQEGLVGEAGGGVGGTGQERVSQTPLPSLMTAEQNRQLDPVLYGVDKQELGEKGYDKEEQQK